MKLAEVVVNVPLEQTFYYIVPDGMEIVPLSRVKVNFAGRNLPAFVLRLLDSNEAGGELKDIKLKEISGTLDRVPVINNTTLKIAEWMSGQYLSPLGESLFCIAPPARKPAPHKHPFAYTGEFSRLNTEQAEAVSAIEPEIGKPASFLIHGITGSGKTEVYKHLARRALDMGRSAIILIPEISLTAQTLRRFYESFGNEVAIYHSRLSDGERLGEWMRALRGEARVVIGPRSAVFAPVKNLGLIIIDEEHEPSYKSGSAPRYHARQVAMYRSRMENAAVVLGSATPQLETYFHARTGAIRLIELKNRYGKATIPKTDIVDMKAEGKGNSMISGPLMKRILETFDKQKQVLLFINRRGFSPSMICGDCGHRFECPSCDVSLTYHKKDHRLVCHHCGYTAALPEKCPSCRSIDLKSVGMGTEKIEDGLSAMFPGHSILRMDLDTTRNKHGFDEILEKIRNHKADLIVGTQMVAKGHDLPGIHLVGALLPDITLNLPDFRSPERNFILLTQVVGRAGRRDIPGEAIIQTYMPDHYSITSAAKQDYVEFYDMEIKKREMFGYPPFTRIARLVFRAKDKEKLEAFVEKLKQYIEGLRRGISADTKILGPVSCPLEKLNNQYRYHIIIKSGKYQQIKSIAQNIRDYFQSSKSVPSLFLEIDIDPLSML
ncbi:MAG: primosomal protein N' [Spirochaetes bacterium GWF1_51_8]|nr:MAG: primosomal protein N' [Spirochaetes bacterium GWF1_51_8]